MKEALLYYAAAGTTAIARILHLLLVPNIIGLNVNSTIFFLVSGIAQIFWVFAQAEAPSDGLQSSTETEVEAKNKCNISGLANSCSQAATSTLTVGAPVG